MNNSKIYFLSFIIFLILIGFQIIQFDGPQSLTNEMEWVLKELPEVKSVEYLDAIKGK
jgi:hypothetical protein